MSLIRTYIIVTINAEVTSLENHAMQVQHVQINLQDLQIIITGQIFIYKITRRHSYLYILYSIYLKEIEIKKINIIRGYKQNLTLFGECNSDHNAKKFDYNENSDTNIS